MLDLTPAVAPNRLAGRATGPVSAMRRRGLLRMVLLGVAAAGAPLALAESRRRPTPEQMRGPFYPPVKPLDVDADLTTIAGHTLHAQGEIVRIQGRVLDVDGRPRPDATMEIWQANAAGRYRHPDDDNPAPLDPEFDGYAVVRTDAQGAWSMTTIKPGAYRFGPDSWRAPHVHFDIRAGRSRLVTQLYFPDDARNADDVLLADCPDPAALIARPLARTERAAGTTQTFGWDIVL